MEKTFGCSAEEWLFARSYSLVRLHDGGGVKPPSFKKFYLWTLVVFAGSAIGSNIYPHFIWMVLILGSMAAGIGLFLWNQYSSSRFAQESLVFPNAGQTVPFIRTAPEGLKINLFNQPDDSSWYVLHWKNLKSVGITIEAKARLSIQIKIAEINFEKAKATMPDFRESAEYKYPDRQQLILNTHRNSTTWIVIPPSWHEDGTLHDLLQQIKGYSGAELHEEPLDI